MEDYKTQIEKDNNPTFQQIVDIARENLPLEKKAKPWSFVNHGVDLLKNEDELNCYLAAYGKMHEEKIHTALYTLTNLKDIINKNYQIIDWGCGQGLATLCFLDFIKANTTFNIPQRVTLIEPSKPALTKAKVFLEANLSTVKVNLIEKSLDDVILSDVEITESVTINFFSNILDIESVNLEKLADLINSNLKGEHYFICVGPMNATSTRIDEFAKLLNFTDEQIIGKENGKLKTTRGTIKLLVFKIKGKEIQIIKSIYYPPMPNNNNYMHILIKKLNSIDSNKLKPVDRIVEYYKLVVELEQLKEPKIDKYYSYAYVLNENNEFVVDLESNKTFLKVFNSNKATKWPKDFNISIELEVNKKKHPVLSYTYIYDDIKDIDTANEKVKLKLSNFELNYRTLTNLEKSEEEIDKLEILIKEQKTLECVLNILREKLNDEFVSDGTLSFALSSKNPALSQIYSELKKVNSHTVKESSLLHDFLFNKPIDNKADNLTENDLIQISNLDDSQKKAVLTAFNNKVSVITGPPGSGKTQVISNILANAVLQNKKVLVASKNNQAVDNVKSRFNREENNGFFLRFGNKQILERITLPEINRISAIQPKLPDNSIKLKECHEKLNEVIKLKTDNKRKLELRDDLQNKLPVLKKNVDQLESNIANYAEINPKFEYFRLNHKVDVIDNYLSISKNYRNYFELKYSGLNKFWIDWFTKKKYAFKLISFINETDKDFREYFKTIPNQISHFTTGAKILETYNHIIKSFDSIVDYYSQYTKIKIELETKIEELKKDENYINAVNSQEKVIKKIIADCEFEIINSSKEVLKEKIENKLFKSATPHINNYKDYLPDNIPWRYEDLPPFINAAKNFLEIFNINCVTSLSAKASLPLTSELFDMVVIDEASQCDIASAIPLILRAKQLVVIGDPLQLKHITSLNRFEEEKIKEYLHLSGSIYLKYKEKSLWDYSESFLANAKNNNSIVNIDRHYRCHPDIIGYSNEAFYIPKRNIKLEICTTANQFQIQPKGIIWENVKGVQQANNVNINHAEVEKSIELATSIANSNPNISIGIVTPFSHQAKEIHKKIPPHLKLELNPRIIADTVHKFQGDEKDVMIYSLVVTNNSPDSKIYWIDNMVQESVNVAVTRARNTLYIVGNKEYIKAKSSVTKPLGKLVQYVERMQNR
jgi:superfamily I DNA and/or RNA helicase